MQIEDVPVKKSPSLLAAIAVGIGSMIGSGWLFACYYASKSSGPASLLAWIIGGIIIIPIAFMLAEISSKFKERGLFGRLITISHNSDYGFVIIMANLLVIIISVSSEAMATTQYLSSSLPILKGHIYHDGNLTAWGDVISFFLILFYGLVNYWGIRFLAYFNNIITFVKFILPIGTALILIIVSFHSSNFTNSANGGFMPYGWSSVFETVVASGIFYSFYGFSYITMFASEIKNPRKNIPLALTFSIVVVLLIYLALQFAYIAAVPPSLLAHGGWKGVDFSSPLAQLLILLNVNVWAVLLYIDSFISPSGSALIYSGAASRLVTGMAQDQHAPQFFNKVDPKISISRRSLVFSLFAAFLVILFTHNWKDIVLVVSMTQVLSCQAVPLCFSKLRRDGILKRDAGNFSIPFGFILAPFLSVTLTYFAAQTGARSAVLTFTIILAGFLSYCLTSYRGNVARILRAFMSSAYIFLYFIFLTLSAYLADQHLLKKPAYLISFLCISIVFYFLLSRQKDYQVAA